MLAQLAQRRRGDLVDLPEQVRGVACVGAAGVRGVRGLGVAQQLGQRPGQHAVLRVLVGQPGVADRLAHLGQRRRVRRRVEERADRVVALQRGADLLDLDLVDAVDRVGPALRVLAQQQLHVELEDVGDLVDDRELVEPADASLDLVDPALRLAQPVGEDLLGHLAAGAPVGDAAADGQLVHVRPPPRSFRGCLIRGLLGGLAHITRLCRSHIRCVPRHIRARSFHLQVAFGYLSNATTACRSEIRRRPPARASRTQT